MILLALAFFSCEEENELGSNIDPAQDKLKVEFREFTLPANNIFFDSVRTDLDPYILTGTIKDDVYGEIEAEGYQSINILTTALPPSDAVLDSVKINLRFSNYFTDPGAKSHTLEVRQIVDTLYDGVVYKSDRSASFIPTVEGGIEFIGKHQFEVNPSTDSVLSFKLFNLFGNVLLDRLSIIRDGNFRSFAPGEIPAIALVSDEGNNALIGFDPSSISSNITLHYHTSTEDSLAYAFVFRGINNADLPGYNHIKVDRSGSAFSVLSEEKLQKVDVDENLVHMNPLSGILPMVDLTGVYDFFDEKLANGDPLNIISAQILMPIDPSDTSEFESSSSSLRYLFADSDGNFDGGQVLLNPARSIVLTDDSYLGIGGGASISVGRLNTDIFSITRDISLFTQLMIENRIDPNGSTEAFPSNLVMMPLQSSAVSQTSFFKDGIKIRVYYTILK